jgi:adenylosuccinate synthase
MLEQCEPVYETIPGWATKTQGIDIYEALPLKAKKYIELIRDMLGVPVVIISTGESRDSTIISRPLFA